MATNVPASPDFAASRNAAPASSGAAKVFCMFLSTGFPHEAMTVVNTSGVMGGAADILWIRERCRI